MSRCLHSIEFVKCVVIRNNNFTHFCVYCGLFIIYLTHFTLPDYIFNLIAQKVLLCLIFSGGGLVLEQMIDNYPGSEVFQPVINGIGGNLVSVHASRMSTMLHQSSIMGILPPHGKIWVFPWTALFVGCTYIHEVFFGAILF